MKIRRVVIPMLVISIILISACLEEKKEEKKPEGNVTMEKGGSHVLTFNTTKYNSEINIKLGYTKDEYLHLYNPQGRHIGHNETTNNTDKIEKSFFLREEYIQTIHVYDPMPGKWIVKVTSEEDSESTIKVKIGFKTALEVAPRAWAEDIKKTTSKEFQITNLYDKPIGVLITTDPWIKKAKDKVFLKAYEKRNITFTIDPNEVSDKGNGWIIMEALNGTSYRIPVRIGTPKKAELDVVLEKEKQLIPITRGSIWVGFFNVTDEAGTKIDADEISIRVFTESTPYPPTMHELLNASRISEGEYRFYYDNFTLETVYDIVIEAKKYAYISDTAVVYFFTKGYDLSLDPNGFRYEDMIKVSNREPVEDEIVTLNVTVYNRGFSKTDSTTVYFYYVDKYIIPQRDTIISNKTIGQINANENVTISINWIAKIGTNMLGFYVNPPIREVEAGGNNFAFIQINVSRKNVGK